MGVLPHNVELPVLSHRHSQNAPRHKLPACSRWSLAVDPFWGAENVSAEFYASNSYPGIPTQWILVYYVTGFGAIQSGSKSGIGGNVVVLQCAWLICFNKGVFKVWMCCRMTLISRSKASAQSNPTTPQTPCVRSVEPGVGSTPGESERYPPSSTRRIPVRWIIVCDVSDFGAI